MRKCRKENNRLGMFKLCRFDQSIINITIQQVYARIERGKEPKEKPRKRNKVAQTN